MKFAKLSKSKIASILEFCAVELDCLHSDEYAILKLCAHFQISRKDALDCWKEHIKSLESDYEQSLNEKVSKLDYQLDRLLDDENTSKLEVLKLKIKMLDIAKDMELARESNSNCIKIQYV